MKQIIEDGINEVVERIISKHNGDPLEDFDEFKWDLYEAARAQIEDWDEDYDEDEVYDAITAYCETTFC